MPKVDMKGFFKFLDAEILPNYNTKETINIAIVTHSHFMVHNHISENNTKPNNNAIFKVIYNGKIINMAHKHTSTIFKKDIEKIYNGCEFNKTFSSKLMCNGKTKTCKKKPTESGKKYYRCGEKGYTQLSKIKKKIKNNH